MSAEQNEVLLEFRNVALVLGGVRIFDGLDLRLRAGDQVAIVGDSGSGKSLIPRLAVGLTSPTSGTLSLTDMELSTLDKKALRLARARCGLVLQGGSLLGDLSVEDNLWLALGAPAAARARLRRRIDRLLLAFELDHLAAHPANTLSGGEQRRVELARAFVREPDLLILDEPFEGAFTRAAALEAQVMRQIGPRGRALLLLTQDAALAHRSCDRVYRLVRGRLVQQVAEAAPVAATS